MNAEILSSLGLGLSRLLRYSYGGFLLIGFTSIMNPTYAESVREALSWQLVALTAIVVGAGLYAVHRNAIVPLHHGLMCLVWLFVDNRRNIISSKSVNPARWLTSLDVHWMWCIPAYSALRRTKLFEKEKREWDIAHAESGMVLMTAEAFFLAGLWACTQSSPQISMNHLFWAAAVLFVASYAGWVQHAIECLRFRQAEDEGEEVTKTLRKLGFLHSSD